MCVYIYIYNIYMQIANKIHQEDPAAQGWVNSCSVGRATFQSPLKAGKGERLEQSEVLVHSRTWLSEVPERGCSTQGGLSSTQALRGPEPQGPLRAVAAELQRWGPLPSESPPTPPSTQIQVFPGLSRCPTVSPWNLGRLRPALVQPSAGPRPPRRDGDPGRGGGPSGRRSGLWKRGAGAACGAAGRCVRRRLLCVLGDGQTTRTHCHPALRKKSKKSNTNQKKER